MNMNLSVLASPFGAGAVYSAFESAQILGIPNKNRDPIPKLRPCELVIYYPEEKTPTTSLTTLEKCPAGRRFMWQNQGTDDGTMAVPGYYRLLFPGASEAIGPGWQPAPVCIAVAARIILLADPSPAKIVDSGEDWWQCDGRIVGVDGGRVYVREFPDEPKDFIRRLLSQRIY